MLWSVIRSHLWLAAPAAGPRRRRHPGNPAAAVWSEDLGPPPPPRPREPRCPAPGAHCGGPARRSGSPPLLRPTGPPPSLGVRSPPGRRLWPPRRRPGPLAPLRAARLSTRRGAPLHPTLPDGQPAPRRPGKFCAAGAGRGGGAEEDGGGWTGGPGSRGEPTPSGGPPTTAHHSPPQPTAPSTATPPPPTAAHRSPPQPYALRPTPHVLRRGRPPGPSRALGWGPPAIGVNDTKAGRGPPPGW